jgi:hypothetical protein
MDTICVVEEHVGVVGMSYPSVFRISGHLLLQPALRPWQLSDSVTV